MARQETAYGLGGTVPLRFQEAVRRTREELANEVAATLKNKLGVDFGAYVILGACNPPLAHRALTAEPEIGLLLPCNVIVYAGEEEGTSVISAINPEAALSLAGNPAIAPLAAEVGARLRRVLGALGTNPGGVPRSTEPIAPGCEGDGSLALDECRPAP